MDSLAVGSLDRVGKIVLSLFRKEVINDNSSSEVSLIRIAFLLKLHHFDVEFEVVQIIILALLEIVLKRVKLVPVIDDLDQDAVKLV